MLIILHCGWCCAPGISHALGTRSFSAIPSIAIVYPYHREPDGAAYNPKRFGTLLQRYSRKPLSNSFATSSIHRSNHGIPFNIPFKTDRYARAIKHYILVPKKSYKNHRICSSCCIDISANAPVLNTSRRCFATVNIHLLQYCNRMCAVHVEEYGNLRWSNGSHYKRWRCIISLILKLLA